MPNTHTRSRAHAQPENRASRRRTQAQQKQNCIDFTREAAGVLGISISRVGGPRPSDGEMRALYSWACAVTESNAAPLCLACDTRLYPSQERGPGGWLIAFPMRDNFEVVSVSVFCPACAARHNDDALCEIAARMYGGRVLPIANVSSISGRA